MSWRDHLQTERVAPEILPWTGGETVLSREAEHRLSRRPREHGWYSFLVRGRTAVPGDPAPPDTDLLRWRVKGYLVGDRLIADGAAVDPDPLRALADADPVRLLEPGLPRFSRIEAGRMRPRTPLVYVGPDFPAGPEQEVLEAYQDRASSVDRIPGVAPALDLAFRMESREREEAARRREELRLRREEEERLEREAERRRQRIAELGDGAGRRRVAAVDFNEAAAAALAVGGAEFLDVYDQGDGEKVVTYRLRDRRFQCVCDARTLRIVEAGICLVDEATGESYDRLFTLESLPGVVAGAMDRGVLHVFRHV